MPERNKKQVTCGDADKRGGGGVKKEGGGECKTGVSGGHAHLTEELSPKLEPGEK